MAVSVAEVPAEVKSLKAGGGFAIFDLPGEPLLQPPPRPAPACVWRSCTHACDVGVGHVPRARYVS